MIGIIWADLGSFERKQAEEQLEKICKDYEKWGISCVRANNLFAAFENGDSWSIVRTPQQTRGRRCNVSYIHKYISQDTIKNFIIPYTSLPPYHAFYVYGG